MRGKGKRGEGRSKVESQERFEADSQTDNRVFISVTYMQIWLAAARVRTHCLGVPAMYLGTLRPRIVFLSAIRVHCSLRPSQVVSILAEYLAARLT